MIHRNLPNGRLRLLMRKNLKRKKNGMNRNLPNCFWNLRKKMMILRYNNRRNVHHYYPMSRNCLPYYGYCLLGCTMSPFLATGGYKHRKNERFLFRTKPLVRYVTSMPNAEDGQTKNCFCWSQLDRLNFVQNLHCYG